VERAGTTLAAETTWTAWEGNGGLLTGLVVPLYSSRTHCPSMLTTMPSRFRILLLILAIAPGAIAAPATADSQLPIRIQRDLESSRVTVLYQNQPLLLYVHHPTQHKPYIKELYDLSGYNVLLDAPPDHDHHHGIMYAVMINGMNYWQEWKETGFQRSVGIEREGAGINAAGRPYATFTDVIDWLDPAGRGTPEGEQPFLRERRTLVVTVDEQTRETAVQWSADFEVGHHAPSITLTGDPYNGLGLRLVRDFDGRVAHRNSHQALDPRQGDPNISKARWSAASIALPSRFSTVAVFGAAANELGDPVYFLMWEPFAYISATQALNKNRLEYQAGSRFRLSFLITVYPEIKSAQFLEERARAWERR
jgi:hypothetical protein